MKEVSGLTLLFLQDDIGGRRVVQDGHEPLLNEEPFGSLETEQVDHSVEVGCPWPAFRPESLLIDIP